MEIAGVRTFRRLFLVGVLGGLGIVLSPFSHEIVYDAHQVFSFCARATNANGRNCVARFEILLGNTGSHSEDLRLVWPTKTASWKRNQSIQNISADQPRAGDPDIACANGPGGFECGVNNLTPGALLFVSLECFGCTSEEASLPSDAHTRILADAHVFQGDPRVSTFLNRLQIFARFF